MATSEQAVSDISPDRMLASPDLGFTATLLRMIGTFFLSDVSVDGLYQVGLGIYISTADAVITAPPDPLSDTNQAWYYWRADRDFHEATVEGRKEPKSFDIRTGRRLRQGYRLGLIFETIGNPGTIQVNLSARMLWSSP